MASVRPTPDTWPAKGLQTLGSCPLCGDARRTVVHRDLEDRLFGVAPGSWTLYRCEGCGLAYLDPRPDAESIGLAYASYYTHEERPDDDPLAPGEGFIGRWKQRVLRDYISARHGAMSGPWRGLLAPIMWLRPRVRRSFDIALRGLPRPWPGARVLDIGCGSGRFVAWARAVGWEATGTDVDPVAVARARQRGLDVRTCDLAGLETLAQEFDAITISHVIEHVHDPRRLLRAAWRLLKPGGYFWIETPNADAWGHAVFGRHWRDLDPPRHLQLFHTGLLKKLLKEAGFAETRIAPWQSDWHATAPASMALAREAGVEKSLEPGPHPERIGRDDPARREFVTLMATRYDCG